MIPYMESVGKEEGINFSYGGWMQHSSISSCRRICTCEEGSSSEYLYGVHVQKYFEEEKSPNDVDAGRAAVASGVKRKRFVF